MQACIVPVISYNYAAQNLDRCKKVLNTSMAFGMVLLFIGTLCFLFIPEQLLNFFSKDEQVISIGINAFRIIGISFIPLVSSLTYPVLFQAVGASFKSSLLTIIRTVFLFVPLGYAFSRFGLQYFWLTYPITEIITTTVGFFMTRSFFKKAKRSENNYRLYDRDALENLWEIMIYKEMGLQLQEIRQLLLMSERGKKEYLKIKIKETEDKIGDLEELKKFISLIVTQGIPQMPDENTGVTYVEKIAAMKKGLHE